MTTTNTGQRVKTGIAHLGSWVTKALFRAHVERRRRRRWWWWWRERRWWSLTDFFDFLFFSFLFLFLPHLLQFILRLRSDRLLHIKN